MTGTSAAPITEKQPLIPQAQMNICSLPNWPRLVMATGIGKPIKKAGGRISAKQHSRRVA